jgi:hypothetical protein
VIHFDEEDISLKHKTAVALAAQLWDLHSGASDWELAFGRDDDCDTLLQLFHRNIEQGPIPYWEGATVSQVCLAEGTQVYVSLGQLAQKAGQEIATLVVEELMNCAWQMHGSSERTDDPRYSDETFVFADEKQHTSASTLTIEDLLIPVAVSYDGRDVHGKLKHADERSSEARVYEYVTYKAPDFSVYSEENDDDLTEDEYHAEQLSTFFSDIQDGFDLVFGENP